MMIGASRQVGVYDAQSAAATGENLQLPEVFFSSVRYDHVHYIHTQIAKNKRCPYAVSRGAGYQTSAESWGTGRAVARIPRVPGGGTHRAGQAAFGNMCRGGGMYSPTKVYRRWHRRTNLRERRHAVASALAASAITSIVEARGHRVGAVPEIPLVVTDDIERLDKTKQAVEMLHKLGLKEELARIDDGRTLKSGRSRMRNRKYYVPVGPLVVHTSSTDHMKAFRNIAGVQTCHVSRLSLLDLAPGGSIGRLLIFSKGAMEQLADVYASKTNYHLRRPLITNEDIRKIIMSDEIQSVCRPKIVAKNPNRRTQHPGRLIKIVEELKASPKISTPHKKVKATPTWLNTDRRTD